MLRKLRPVPDDKRFHGHLFLLAGSRELGGAAMMSAQAALKAGVGLLTVGIPESLHSAFAAQLPEAMWLPLPETPEGSLALEGLGKIRQSLARVTAIAAGPGLGTEKETHALVREVCKLYDGPVLLDADALRPEIVEKISCTEKVVLSPHAGEFKRLAGDLEPQVWLEKIPSPWYLRDLIPKFLITVVVCFVWGAVPSLPEVEAAICLQGCSRPFCPSDPFHRWKHLV